MLQKIDKDMNEYPWCYVLKIDPFAKKSDVKEIKEIDQWELLIIFKNGEKIILDKDTGYYRNLFYKNINELTEEQERKEFGYALRTMMRRRWINQEKLAEAIGTSQTMVSHYMTGRYIPNGITLRKIAKVLKCSMDDLFFIDYSEYLEED